MSSDHRSAFDPELREIRAMLEGLLREEPTQRDGVRGRDPRLDLIVRWLDLLTRRIVAQERRSMDLVRRMRGTDASLGLVCEVLRQLDDPYGFGESLDSRIAAESSQNPPEKL
jgi:hypothetical protein